MRIFTEKPLKQYADSHPEARTAIQDWICLVLKNLD